MRFAHITASENDRNDTPNDTTSTTMSESFVTDCYILLLVNVGSIDACPYKYHTYISIESAWLAKISIFNPSVVCSMRERHFFLGDTRFRAGTRTVRMSFIFAIYVGIYNSIVDFAQNQPLWWQIVDEGMHLHFVMC